MPKLETPRALPEKLHNGEAPEGPPVALPGSSREGISLLPVRLSSPAPELWCSQPWPETTRSPRTLGCLLAWVREPGLWEAIAPGAALSVRGQKVGGLPEILHCLSPGKVCIHSRNKPLFSPVTRRLIYQGQPLPGFSTRQNKQSSRRLPFQFAPELGEKRIANEELSEDQSPCTDLWERKSTWVGGRAPSI